MRKGFLNRHSVLGVAPMTLALLPRRFEPRFSFTQGLSERVIATIVPNIKCAVVRHTRLMPAIFPRRTVWRCVREERAARSSIA